MPYIYLFHTIINQILHLIYLQTLRTQINFIVTLIKNFINYNEENSISYFQNAVQKISREVKISLQLICWIIHTVNIYIPTGMNILIFLSKSNQTLKIEFQQVSEVEKTTLEIKDPQAPFEPIEFQNFNSTMQKFLYSFKSMNSPNINRHSLMFLTGPEKHGKSWYLMRNLERFQNSKVNKAVILIDLEKFEGLPNFQNFLHHFESQSLQSIIQANDQFYSQNKRDALTRYLCIIILNKLGYRQRIISVIDRHYSLKLINRLIYKSLKSALDGNQPQQMKLNLDQNNFYLINDKQKIQQLLISYNNSQKQTKQNFFTETNYKQLLQAQGVDRSEQLRFFLSVLLDTFAMRENQKRPIPYLNSYYRNGLQTQVFILDLLNQLAGYSQFYNLKREVTTYNVIDYFNQENKQNKKIYLNQMNQQKDQNAFAQKQKQQFHVVMAINGCDKLWYMRGCENRAKEWVQRLIVRLYVIIQFFSLFIHYFIFIQNPAGYRKHFPIIMEFSRRNFDINYMMKFRFGVFQHNLPQLQFYSMMTDQLVPKVIKNFIPEQNSKMIMRTIGPSLYHLHLLIEQKNLISNFYFREIQNYQLKGHQNKREIFKKDGLFNKELIYILETMPTFKRLKNQFLHKIYNLYNNRLYGQFIDNGNQAKYQILHVLDFTSKKQQALFIFKGQRTQVFVQNHFPMAFSQQELLYFSKHFQHMTFHHRLHHIWA